MPPLKAALYPDRHYCSFLIQVDKKKNEGLQNQIRKERIAAFVIE